MGIMKRRRAWSPYREEMTDQGHGERVVAVSLQNTKFWVHAGYYTGGQALKYV